MRQILDPSDGLIVPPPGSWSVTGKNVEQPNGLYFVIRKDQLRREKDQLSFDRSSQRGNGLN